MGTSQITFDGRKPGKGSAVFLLLAQVSSAVPMVRNELCSIAAMKQEDRPGIRAVEA